MFSVYDSELDRVLSVLSGICPLYQNIPCKPTAYSLAINPLECFILCYPQ